ncbi:MAG: hypothetical protein ABS78_17375 [Phenylobacterium sp. SCN 70-31]|nr:MAG: hypothetical protein ABS78_17375 [Phenylobacterium sp. SCN 70-31]
MPLPAHVRQGLGVDHGLEPGLGVLDHPGAPAALAAPLAAPLSCGRRRTARRDLELRRGRRLDLGGQHDLGGLDPVGLGQHLLGPVADRAVEVDVGVEQAHAPPQPRQGGRQVHRDRRLAHPALAAMASRAWRIAVRSGTSLMPLCLALMGCGTHIRLTAPVYKPVRGFMEQGEMDWTEGPA